MLFQPLSGIKNRNSNQSLSVAEQAEHRDCLVQLIKKLTQFAMLLGGFGKSWRRADHQIFLLNNKIYNEHLIGCHWDWVDPGDNTVNNQKEVTELIQSALTVARSWMKLRAYTEFSFVSEQNTKLQTDRQECLKSKGVFLKSDKPAFWREAWHADNVQVWGRPAKNEGDSKVIPWLHSKQLGITQPDRARNRTSSSKSSVNVNQAIARPSQQSSNPSIYRTSVSGRVYDKKKDGDRSSENTTQIGRLWHRMYLLAAQVSDEDVINCKESVEHQQYLELLTIFPNRDDCTESFLKYLREQQSEFKLLWPIPQVAT